jgi:multiple sugar transport system substrate-binding protein
MPTFVEQATTLTPEDVAQVTVSFAGKVNTILRNELDLCFTGKQSVDDALQKIADQLETAAAG